MSLTGPAGLGNRFQRPRRPIRRRSITRKPSRSRRARNSSRLTNPHLFSLWRGKGKGFERVTGPIERNPQMTVVGILVVIVLVLLVIYLFRRVA